MACWQRTLEPTIYVTTKISANQMLMVALLLTPAILSQNSAMLDKASQASCLQSFSTNHESWFEHTAKLSSNA